jgi:hypothetical protein
MRDLRSRIGGAPDGQPAVIHCAYGRGDLVAWPRSPVASRCPARFRRGHREHLKARGHPIPAVTLSPPYRRRPGPSHGAVIALEHKSVHILRTVAGQAGLCDSPPVNREAGYDVASRTREPGSRISSEASHPRKRQVAALHDSIFGGAPLAVRQHLDPSKAATGIEFSQCRRVSSRNWIGRTPCSPPSLACDVVASRVDITLELPIR